MIYLDYASSNQSYKEIIESYTDLVLSCGYLNQEASHRVGRTNSLKIQQTSELLSAFFFGNNDENCVFFHTASDVFAHLFGFFNDDIFITTHAEHEALLTNLPPARTQYVKLHSNGLIDLDDLGRLIALYPKAIIITHHVNSETGVIQDIAGIGSILKENKLIIDAVQSVGKVMCDYAQLKVDMWLFSTHKLGAPACAPVVHKMMGFQKYCTQLRKDYVIGRVDMANCVTSYFALDFHQKYLLSNVSKWRAFQEKIRTSLSCYNICFFADRANVSFSICSFLMDNIQSAVFLRMLSEQGVMVAAGSACQSESKKPSKTLSAMRVESSKIWGLLRVSFSSATTQEEIDSFIEKFHYVMKNY